MARSGQKWQEAVGVALTTEERPVLDVVAIDVRELAFGSGIPDGIDAMIPIERHWKQRSSQAPIYEAI